MKIKLKVQEYFKRILCTFMLIVLLFPSLKVKAAATKEEVGSAIASFAISFHNNYGSRVKWYDVDTSDPNSYGKRAAAYNESNVGSMSEYYMDCVGWVNYAIHHATGLNVSGARIGNGSFVSPQSGSNTSYFENVTGQELQPGDILVNSHHVMIYVGNDMLIDSRGDGLTYTTLTEYGNNGNYTNATYGPGTYGVYDSVYRISDAGVAAIDGGDLVSIVPAVSASNKKDYNYYGLPTKGGYVGSKGTLAALKSVINVLSQIADYLIGLKLMGIKVQLIGWTTIVENLITDVVNKVTSAELTGTDTESETEETEESSTEEEESLYTPSALETVTGFFVDKEDRLTVEKVIYNQVPIFDVNIFNIEEAGGQKLNPDGTLAAIKKNIAIWYYVLRNISIIGLLIVLIYIAIRMAMSTVASEKAVYKRYLKDWLVSFIIAFCIHYVMILILNINEYLIDLIKDSAARFLNGENQEYLIYETVRTKAYEIKFSSGLTGTVMYMILVYLLVRYIFVYAKRYLTVNILSILAPVISITYSIDKIKDSKSQSLGTWLRDYTFTVLLQSVHALVYSLFIPIALTTSEENLTGIVFVFILMNFMLKADKIIINIFGMKGKSFSNVSAGYTLKQALGVLAGYKIVAGFYGTGIKIAGWTAKGIGTTVVQAGSLLISDETRYKINRKYNKAVDIVFGENSFIDKRRTNNIKTVSGIDNIIKAKKRQYRKEMRKYLSYPVRQFAKHAAYTGLAIIAVPAMVISPATGVGIATKLIFDGKPKSDKNYTANKTGRGSLNNVVANLTNRKNRVNNTETGNSTSRTTRTGNTSMNNTPTGRNSNSNTTRTRTNNSNASVRTSRLNGIIDTVRTAAKAEKETADSLQRRFTKSISILEQAKSLEEDIIEKYAGMRESVYDRFKNNAATPAASKVPGIILAKLDEKYDKMIEEIFKDVSETDIIDTVMDYAKEESTTGIDTKDIEEIISKLQERLDKKEDNNIKLNEDSIIENIKAMIKKEEDDKIEKGLEIVLGNNDISLEEVTPEQKENIIEDLRKILESDGDSASLYAALGKSLIAHGIKGDISDSIKQEIITTTRRRMKTAKEKTYKPNEVVSLMKKSLEKQDSIEREEPPAELEEIADSMEQLKEVNRKYDKTFGQKIFTKDEIIKSMQETKKAKKFDLFESIINEE